MSKWGYLAITLIFILLLTAGLDYTGRNIHYELGGDKIFYAFFLPDPNDNEVVFCGRAYTYYPLQSMWDRQLAACGELWQAASPELAQLALSLSSRFQCLWSFLETSLTVLERLFYSLLALARPALSGYF